MASLYRIIHLLLSIPRKQGHQWTINYFPTTGHAFLLEGEAYGITFDYRSTKFTTKCHLSQNVGGFLNPNQVKGIDKNVK